MRAAQIPVHRTQLSSRVTATAMGNVIRSSAVSPDASTPLLVSGRSGGYTGLARRFVGLGTLECTNAHPRKASLCRRPTERTPNSHISLGAWARGNLTTSGDQKRSSADHASSKARVLMRSTCGGVPLALSGPSIGPPASPTARAAKRANLCGRPSPHHCPPPQAAQLLSCCCATAPPGANPARWG